MTHKKTFENRGAVWLNTNKQSDTHADYTGSINVEGKEYWLNMWEQEPEGNQPNYKFSVTLKRKKSNSGIPF